MSSFQESADIVLQAFGNVAMGRTCSPQRKSYIIFAAILVFTTWCLLSQPQTPEIPQLKYITLYDQYQQNETENSEIRLWLEEKKSLKGLSKLGRILYQDEEEPRVQDTRRYKILVWKYGSYLENRHIKTYSSSKSDPFEFCPVKNCDITYQNADLATADIVIFHLQRMKGLDDLPKPPRNPDQIWAFLTDESPYHTFLKSGIKLSLFNGIFNWSMTYRKDSDIPVPYGRTIIKKNKDTIELSFKKRKDILVAILGSNCGGKNHRWDYVKELQKNIKVDVYGGCGPIKTCPGHFTSDCPNIGDYLFYLAFENSNCDDYITEKLWWNAYMKNSIPIVMGAEQSNYRLLLPPDSYINVDNFASPAVLAQFIYRLNSTEEYKSYYKWKKHFEVLNEHAYFKSKSYHYCRVCQAMNYNDKSKKVYEKLEDFWNVQKDCHPAWNEWN